MKTFTHIDSPLKLRILESETLKSGRSYIDPDTGEKYPSITTILGHIGRGPIQEWRKRVGEKEANRVSRVAASRGTNFHDMLETYLRNQKETKKRMPNETGPFSAIKSVLDDHVDNIQAMESTLFSRKMKVAGRVDLIAEYKGSAAIIDFKSANKPKKRDWIHSYFKQATAYALMYHELTGIRLKYVVIIIAADGLDRAQVFCEKVSDWVEPLFKDIAQYRKDKLFGHT